MTGIRFFLSIIIFAASCGQPAGESKVEKSAGTDTLAPAVSRPAESEKPAEHPFTKEDAETLLAKYYSALNRQAAYLKYKGLGLSIIAIDSSRSEDSIYVKALAAGRIWENPQRDTLTKPFRKELQFTAWKEAGQWTSSLRP